MAAVTFGNTTANVPDVWYMANDMTIQCSSTSSSVSVTANGYTERRVVQSGECRFSLTPFALAGFDTDGLTQLGAAVTGDVYESLAVRSIEVTLTDNADTTKVTVPCIWGGYDIATEIAGTREVWMACDDAAMWLTTLRLISPTAVVTVDGGIPASQVLPASIGGYDYTLDAFGSFSGWSEVTVECSETLPTHDNQHKSSNIATTLHIINTAACGSGLLPVRWLDAEGRLHCRSLKVHERQQTVSTDASYSITGDMDSSEAVDEKAIWLRGKGKYRSGMQVQRTLTLAAPNQRKELIPELMTLAASEFAAVLVDDTNGVWRRINVVDSQLTETSKHLQDFAVQVEVFNIKTLLR